MSELYQTRGYNVVPANDLYVVTNLRGKVVSQPGTYAEACATADLYQGDDDAEAAEAYVAELACASEDR